LHSVANPDTDSVSPPDGRQPAGRLFKVRTVTARSSHVRLRAVLRGLSAVLHGQAEIATAFPSEVKIIYPLFRGMKTPLTDQHLTAQGRFYFQCTARRLPSANIWRPAILRGLRARRRLNHKPAPSRSPSCELCFLVLAFRYSIR